MNKKQLIIYDFDDTLFKSVNRNEGEQIYFEATGKKWPYQGWYGRIETLLPPIINKTPDKNRLIPDSISAYNKDIQNNDAKVVLMTGRPYKMKWRILEILDHFNLKFHNYYFRGMRGQKGSDTIEIKINIIIEELFHPKLEVLEIYEDRQEHVDSFLSAINKFKECCPILNKIIIHNVTTKQDNFI